jgi:mannose-6-phosphate isomerase
MKLETKSVTKPWGVTALPAPFASSPEKIGEIWFQAPEGVALRLMTKYLFTSEKLSVQVHPNDRQARKSGLAQGKDECWYILSAEPDATLGLGLTKEVSAAKLRAAAATGAIEDLIDWKPVKSGDFFYVPSGTVHAIGAGVSLIEVQPNVDVTYRLYDYGRPRELHLDAAVEAAKPKPFDMVNYDHIPADMSAVMLDGPKFRLFQIVGDYRQIIARVEASEWQIIPIEGSVRVRDAAIAPGEIGICSTVAHIDLSDNSRCLVACTMD